jgi:M6 family metalloprotease-like protein
MRSIIWMFVLASFTFAINPPDKGKLPAKVIKVFNENPEFIKYGDSGWLRKIADAKFVSKSLSKTSGVALTFKLPVLLGDFPDVSGTFLSSTFQNHLFDDNPTGTLTEYYSEISYGNFNLTGTVYGWFTADQNEAFYQGDGNGFSGTFPGNVKGYVYNIVSKADASVNFGQFDNDGPDGIPNSGDDDGYADAVCVVYPQAGADWSPGNDNFWPHMSSLGDTVFITNDASANGGKILVSSYFVCPEEAGGGDGNGSIRPMGVFAHEFGHVLGLPDLYDRTDDTEGPDFEDSEGIGEWCLMGSGSWGGDGAHSETPAHMSAWCKMQLGWVIPVEIVEQTNNISIKQIETNADVYIIWEDPYYLSRYFLVENRQKTGFDKYLNGDGLLVYHVDENRSWGAAAWSIGFANDDETHKLVDLEEADGLANLDNSINRGDSGDPYPGSSTNKSFNNTSSPSSKDYNNLATGVSIINISNSASTMTVDIMPRQKAGYSLSYDEYGISAVAGANSPDFWSGVVFTSNEAGILKSVDFGIFYGNQDYQILVYNALVSNKPGSLMGSKSGHANDNGWQTISFDNDINISAGQSFFVAVKIINQAFMTFDYYNPISGRSYYSFDGINYFSASAYGDINLRARIQTSTATSIDIASNKVDNFKLEQNYPNPFNPQTSINFNLAEDGKINLSVYDICGRLIRTLVDKNQSAGKYSVTFNADNLSSGVYIYKLTTEKFSATKKMLFVK